MLEWGVYCYDFVTMETCVVIKKMRATVLIYYTFWFVYTSVRECEMIRLSSSKISSAVAVVSDSIIGRVERFHLT